MKLPELIATIAIPPIVIWAFRLYGEHLRTPNAHEVQNARPANRVPPNPDARQPNWQSQREALVWGAAGGSFSALALGKFLADTMQDWKMPIFYFSCFALLHLWLAFTASWMHSRLSIRTIVSCDASKSESLRASEKRAIKTISWIYCLVTSWPTTIAAIWIAHSYG